MKSRSRNRRDVPFTVQSFSLFVDKVILPFFKERQRENRMVRKELETIRGQYAAILDKLKGLHREYRLITDQTRQLELRLQGATQQAIVVLKYQMSSLQKKIESLEGRPS